MTAAPPVSVVVPTYNNAAYVAATLDSILGQTFTDFELVVADHSSQDGTLEIVSGYLSDSRVRVIRTEPGGGAERNWNRVTDQARGEYVKLVCGDDLIYPTCVAKQVSAMQNHDCATLVASRRDIIDANGHVLIASRGLAGMDGEVQGTAAIRQAVRAGGNILGEPACVLLRREVIARVGGWSAADPYLIDMDMYVKALGLGSLVAIPTALAAFRVSSSQWSVALFRDQARQTRSFNRRVATEFPGILSSVDLRYGDFRAYSNAIARRFAYRLWSRRISSP